MDETSFEKQRPEQTGSSLPPMPDDLYRELVKHLATAPRKPVPGESESVYRSWKVPDRRLSPDDQRIQKLVRIETRRRLGLNKRRRGDDSKTTS